MQVMEALAAAKPAVAEAEVRKVQDRFRAKHYCERVLHKAAAAKALSPGLDTATV